MVKKVLVIICVLISPIIIASDKLALTSEEINRKNKELLAQNGLLIPEYNEINIIPASTYLNSKNNLRMAEKITRYLAINEKQQKDGYYKHSEPRAKELIELKYVAPYQKEKFKGVISSKSTHIRSSSEEIKMAYTFLGVPREEITLSIGVAPYGAYKSVRNGDSGEGWDGAVEFFEQDGVGSCAYYEQNRWLAHIGVELIKELVSYEVQSKPTIILVTGNSETGYIYKVKWYDSIFSRQLECANLTFSYKLKSDIISLAKRIDSYQQG